ncbi:RNA polymerase sigma-70 factor, ECF subfamily [Pedobacter rhizosphaerae]|uniref:RNA polymerase sigma-70 factor, ECF subfamily n=1 Tax=Pedobacter rhizosphaerae TaxID=390241 RepID=A0A1H9JT95_9SPHI|nr:RNA polymerase sigma-70 factor, ECF subfamily [Pedobacter rhizosphaerae]
MIKKRILSFEEILKGCVKNDNGCKEMMYKSFYGYLLGIILRYTKNTSDSEELVNDCFIKIFKHIGTFKAPQNPEELKKSFKGWIAQIASRTAIDKIRTAKAKFYVDDLGEDEHPVSQVSVTSDLHVNDILNLLNHLPDTHRLVFNLYEIEGFAHDEISKMLNFPESSSRVYLTRAKNKLRTLYLNTMVSSYEKNG